MYRRTVFKANGELVEPVQRVRSRTGTHGTDVYELQPGIYYVALLSRPNNGTKPISIRYRRLIVDSSVRGQDVTGAELPREVVSTIRRMFRGPKRPP